MQHSNTIIITAKLITINPNEDIFSRCIGTVKVRVKVKNWNSSLLYTCAYYRRSSYFYTSHKCINTRQFIYSFPSRSSPLPPPFALTFATFPFTTFYRPVPLCPFFSLSSSCYIPSSCSYVFILLIPPARRFARTAATRLMTIFNRASRAAIHNPVLPRHISTGDRPGSPLSSESADTLHPLCVTCRWTTDIAASRSSLSLRLPLYFISILFVEICQHTCEGGCGGTRYFLYLKD